MNSTLEQDLSSWEKRITDVKSYLESLLFSGYKQNEQYVSAFLNTVQNNPQVYPNLNKVLSNEIKLNKHGSIDKSKYIKYAIQSKIFGNWDRQSGGFFREDLPKQLNEYKLYDRELFNKCIEKIYKNKNQYNIALQNMGANFLQFLNNDVKENAYLQYINYLMDPNTQKTYAVNLEEYMQALSSNEKIDFQQYMFTKLSRIPHINNALEYLNLKAICNQPHLAGGAFIQVGNGENVGVQGWKLHISIDNQALYNKAINIMLQEYKKQNISCFKIVHPQQMIEDIDLMKDPTQANKNICGKEITIYLNMLTTNPQYSQQFLDLFNMATIKSVKSDKKISGLVNARYGCFSSTFKELILPDGSFVSSEANENRKLNYITAQTDLSDFANLLNLPKQIYQSFLETQDTKRYYQDVVTGRKSNDGDVYVFTERIIDDKYVNDVKDELYAYNKQHFSNPLKYNICKIHDKYILFCDIFQEKQLNEFQEQFNTYYKQRDNLEKDCLSNITFTNQTLHYPSFCITNPKQEIFVDTTIRQGEAQVLTMDMMPENYGLQSTKDTNTKKGFFKNRKNKKNIDYDER